MRTLETALIIVNVLALLLSFKRQLKLTWLGIVAVNLVVSFLHDIFEGLRYQMAFSYMFVILMTVLALKIAISGHEVKISKALKIMTIGPAFAALVFTAFLAHAFPVFTLPKPTGNSAVGIQYFHLIDQNRTDPFVGGSTKPRELMVKFYYPAEADRSKPFSPYFHGSTALLRLLSSGYGMPSFLFDQLSLVRTHGKEELQLSAQQYSYPVVLFSHGAGTSMETLTAQCEDLASHGYIVAAIDHTYVSAATIFPDHIASAKQATTNFDIPEPAEIITQIMADDGRFVIQALSDMNAGRIDSMFQGRLNLDEIGYIGHSVGGAVAYNLAINDKRIKAAIDLDGIVFITPKTEISDMAPFLMLANDRYHIQALQSRKPLMKTLEEMDDVDRKITIDIYGSEQAYRQAYGKAQQNIIGLTQVLKTSGDLFTIQGSDHMKLTDIGLFIGLQPLREAIGIGGRTEPKRCLEITEAVTLTFFDRHLKGDIGASWQAPLNRYLELERVDLQ
jgi:dienelactone hydrolase